MIRPHWGRRTWTVVAGLSIVALLAGISSEVLATTVSKFSSKGPELFVEWNLSTASTATSVASWVDSQVTGPGMPTPVTAAEVSFDMIDFTSNTEITFFNIAPLGPSDFLTVDSNLTSGSTSVTSQGTVNYWDWNAGTVNSVAATASLNASVDDPQYTEDEKSSDRVFNRSAGVDSRSTFAGRFGWYPSGTGAASILDANGLSTQFVAPGTSVSAAFVASLKNRSRTVSR
jgi:hypothetical protein